MSDSIEMKCKSCGAKLVPKFAISELRTASVLPVCPYCIRGRRKMEPQEAQNEESSLTSRVRELEKENEELKAKFQRFAEANQWDALKIVEGFEKEQSLTSRVHELGKENDALKEELKRRYERDIWSDNHSRTEIFMERDKYMEENRRLREALEVIAKPSIGWDGSSNEMRQIARQALKDARAAIDQAAKKEGE